MISIDGYGPVQEYLRYPSNWNQIKSNLEKIAKLPEDKIDIICVPVVQKANLSNIIELFDYLNEINIANNRPVIKIHPSILNHPLHLDLLYLPLNYKQKQWEKIQEWVKTKYFNCNYTPFESNLKQLENKCNADVEYIDNLSKFKEFTEIFDTHRKCYLKDINPELYQIMTK